MSKCDGEFLLKHHLLVASNLIQTATNVMHGKVKQFRKNGEITFVFSFFFFALDCGKFQCMAYIYISQLIWWEQGLQVTRAVYKVTITEIVHSESRGVRRGLCCIGFCRDVVVLLYRSDTTMVKGRLGYRLGYHCFHFLTSSRNCLFWKLCGREIYALGLGVCIFKDRHPNHQNTFNSSLRI